MISWYQTNLNSSLWFIFFFLGCFELNWGFVEQMTNIKIWSNNQEIIYIFFWAGTGSSSRVYIVTGILFVPSVQYCIGNSSNSKSSSEMKNLTCMCYTQECQKFSIIWNHSWVAATEKPNRNEKILRKIKTYVCLHNQFIHIIATQYTGNDPWSNGEFFHTCSI